MADEPLDTEAKIKEAARKIFLTHGYEGAKIRQIAEEAGVNIALVNYYFRSKEQLFTSVYAETFRSFFGVIAQLINEPTPLEVKVWKMADKYIDFLLDNPLVPQFVLSQHGKNGVTLIRSLNIKSVFENSVLTKQLREGAEAGTIRAIHPFQFIITMMSNMAFPFVARPVIQYIGDLDEAGFRSFMNERKTVIPTMMMSYLKQV